ncbi:O-antigen ligase family protein [Acetobacterium bakii]|uniref:O-antigen ligase-related domain-containing protein n=1 Tax=Acetobacterium bakii TaxID=52689 RepID=A0A0L6U3M4_9FIRM|nr:O-antigen ligase family protein [Acetobacterium bakii]KNZ43123.1 hypothetical protein AKG39_02945 [Acetobacterium bakii]
MKNPVINYEKLRNAKSLAEVLAQVPESIFEGILFYLLAFFCVSPLVMLLLLNLEITFFNPYLLVLQIGYVATIFTMLLAYKRSCEKSQKESKRECLINNLHFIFLGTLLFWAILSTLFSSDMQLSFFGDYYRKEGLLTMGAYAGIFTGMLSIHSEQLKHRIIRVFVFSAVVLGAVVTLQYLGFPIKSVVYQFGVNDDKPFILWAGIFHNINHYGYYLSIAVMAAGGLFIFETRKIGIFISGFWFVLLAGVLVANNTFGSYLGVLAALFILTVVYIYRKEKVKRIFLLLVLFLGVSLLVNSAMGSVAKNFAVLAVDVKNIVQVAGETNGDQQQAEALTLTEDEKKSNDLANRAGSGRWRLWVGAVQIIKENPLFGTGPDNLATAYEEMGIAWDRPHNEFLQIGASMGIPALIFYSLALGFGFWKALRHLKELSPATIIACGACTGYLISALFGNTMYYTYPYFLIFLAIAFSKTPMEGSYEPYQKL